MPCTVSGVERRERLSIQRFLGSPKLFGRSPRLYGVWDMGVLKNSIFSWELQLRTTSVRNNEDQRISLILISFLVSLAGLRLPQLVSVAAFSFRPKAPSPPDLCIFPACPCRLFTKHLFRHPCHLIKSAVCEYSKPKPAYIHRNSYFCECCLCINYFVQKQAILGPSAKAIRVVL